MPSFLPPSDALIWGATCVPNAFFTEFMPYAPENYVKVYLYAAMLAQGDSTEGSSLLVDLVKALEISQEEAENALRYWERCRLVERIKDDPPLYRLTSVAKVVSENRLMPEDPVYDTFAKSVYHLFEGRARQIHGAEIRTAYEWVEQLRLPPEVVTMLIQHMLDTHGEHFSFRTAQKLAAQMGEEGIRSLEDAELFFESRGKRYSNVKAVLSKLGQKRRDPSDPEQEIYDKWTKDWGFSQPAILAACDETLSAQSPTFAYLDKILASRKEQGITGKKALQASFAAEREESEKIREVLRELGITQDTIEMDRATYRDLARNGHELALIAAQQVKAHSKVPTLDKVQDLILAWEKKGLVTAEAVKGYIRSVADIDRIIRGLSAHLRKSHIACNEANRSSISKWLEAWRMPLPLAELAADYAAETDRPVEYMEKLLSVWKEQGISTPEAARQSHDRFVQQYAQSRALPRQPKMVNAQMYEQRTDNLTDEDKIYADILKELDQYGIQ